MADVEPGRGPSLFEKPMTLQEKITCTLIDWTSLFVFAYYGVKALFRDRKTTEKSWRRNIYPGLLRFLISHKTIRQRRWNIPETSQVVKEECKRENWQHDVVDLDFGAKLHWVGPHSKSVKRVLLYMHGGAYIMPMVSGHVTFLQKCRRQAERGSRKPWALALVEYGVAPEAQHPTQLRQAVACLEHLLSQGYEPSNIIIGGDSAGGHLCLALISHLLHERPNVNPLKISSPLAGMMLISPWVSFSHTAPSFEYNRKNDYLDLKSGNQSVALFLGTTPDNLEEKRDEYTDPLLADIDWWEDINDVVSEVLIVVGGHEVFLDHNVELGKKLEKVMGKSVETRVTGFEAHVGCILDDVLGMEPVGMAETVWGWLRETAKIKA